MTDLFWGILPLQDATWTDWADIALLSWLIYRVLLTMRGTRAFQVLLGGFIIAAVYVIAEYTGLNALHWVLDNIFVYLVVAVLILFQDDIRRALARAGGVFSTGASSVSDAAAMEEVIKACTTLARRRIGALVILERSESLAALAEGAHGIDGKVTAELLQCIFHPTSPIHDGAVVISADRLVSAGVFLPVSLSSDLPRIYGTRHRAAIGVTEQTDGIAIVVSEERGTIAVVDGGKIEPVVDADDLRIVLNRHLSTKPEQPIEEVSSAA